MRISLILYCLLPISLFAQFDPAGGEPGSLSIHKDHIALTSWADSVIISRSWVDYADTSLGKVDAGEPQNAVGMANGTVVSLGDGGSATFYFAQALIDQEGADFAVFENGFKTGDGYFLELAFVELSKNGTDYVRFPARSIADTTVQFSNADVMSPTWYRNLAGKHQSPYGTLFDFSEIEMDSIHYIRIVDVIGAIGQSFTNRDSEAWPINDSYPTAFQAGGFDIDALGLINGQLLASQTFRAEAFVLYPSIIKAGEFVSFNLEPSTEVQIFNNSGLLVYKGSSKHIQLLQSGLYYINYEVAGALYKHKLCVY